MSHIRSMNGKNGCNVSIGMKNGTHEELFNTVSVVDLVPVVHN